MNTRGFTLIETMVAITVLALALTGPFVAVQNALRAAYTARDQLTASSLAQEGLEYVRSIRDNNYLASPQRNFMDGLSGYSCYGATPSTYCTLDPTRGDVHTAPTAVEVCASPESCEKLYLSSNHLYNQQAEGTPTRFTRVVQFKPVGGSSTEVEVIIQVFWMTGIQQYSITVTDILHDWI